jgi:hypothetical protein
LRQHDCPAELKILVADMLTAYDNYRQGHACLYTASTHADIHQASKQTVESYLENRLIWKELKHYKEKGTILGEHKIFSWMKRAQDIRGMKIGELVTMKKNLEHKLITAKASVRKQPGHPQTLKRNERIVEMNKELAEVNRLLYL